jgi:chemotaxis protein MotB
VARTRMLGLAVVALLAAGCASEKQYEKTQEQLTEEQKRNAELEQEYQHLNQAMGSDLAAKQLQIARLQDAIKVVVNSELLFPSGGWGMSEQAKALIDKIAGVLAAHQTTKIFVKGFTDNVPIGPVLAREGVTSNLILSQRRADTVMQHLISRGVKPALVSAQGFGEADPVASNDTAAGRAENRRVELSLSMAK